MTAFRGRSSLDGTNVLVNRTEPQALDPQQRLFAPATLGSAEFAVPPGTPANPHVINVQFVFHAGNNGASPALVLVLPPQSLTVPARTYGYLSGTSQATPHGQRDGRR